MTFDEFRAELKKVGKPELVIKLLQTKYKVKKLQDLKAELYEDVLEAAKKVK